MADIVELTIERLPRELVDIVFSYLGTSPSADIIKGAIEDIKEYEDPIEDRLGKDKLIILRIENKYSSFGKYPIYNNAFFKVWKECIALNNRLNLIRKSPKMILDITQNYLKKDNLKCVGCYCYISIDNCVNYGERCEWCYATYLGQEVYSCDRCGYRSFCISNFRDVEGFLCWDCEDETDEENEIDEEEFWDE